MSQVLYRKYRSRNFDDLIGQDQIVSVLKQTVKLDKPAHAYLFCGPRGTGKTSTARIFARQINSIAEDKKVENYVDVIEIDAASNRGINEIRELKEKIAFAPAQLKYKVYIIDEVHMLTKEAFNALLKTLEEPPAHAIFIMATTESHKIPATILSRVIRFDFKLATRDQIKQKLDKVIAGEKITIEEKGLMRIIRLAKGSYRDAESLLEKVINMANTDSQITAEQIYDILGVSSEDQLLQVADAVLTGGMGLAELDEKITAVFQRGIDPQQFLFDLSELLLEKLIATTENESLAENKSAIYRFIGELQQLLGNYNQFLDPTLTVRISLINLAAKINSADPKHVKQVHVKKSVQTAKASDSSSKSEELNKQELKAEDNRQPISASPADSQLHNTLVTKIKQQDIRLGTMVGQGRLETVGKGKYKLLLPYKFHLEQVSKMKNKQLVITNIQKIVGIEECQLVLEQDSVSKNKPSKKSAKENKSSQSNQELVEKVFGDMIN